MLEYLNIPFMVAMIGWAVAQLIKATIYGIRYKTFKLERLFGSGGMPSSHSATVCSFVMVIYHMEGPTSAIFGLSLIVAMITMYDAMGVRRASGLHAKQINRLRRMVEEIDEELLDDLDEKVEEEEIDPEETKELKEFLGHTPLQVIFGALLGIIIGVIANFIIS